MSGTDENFFIKSNIDNILRIYTNLSNDWTLNMAALCFDLEQSHLK